MQPTASSTTKTRFRPTRIAPETFLVHDHEGEGKAPVLVPLNTMVIRSSEPVVVDTGMAENREQFLADVFGLVEPADVRWVYLSHDDVDHTGNVNALMEACPNATLILNWFMVERMGASLAVAPTRWRWIGDGESFDVGDRTLHAVRPPIFDSPTTRGLFDPTTGVYWASDSFATPMLAPITDVRDLDHDFWIDGMKMFNQYVSPWLELVDDARFQATVQRVADLRPTAMAGCHTPVIGPDHVAAALAAARATPTAIVPPQPDQHVLDEILRSLMAGAAA
ncbi:MAG: MBL fold metallo-hydrolase [Acidimicrobiales bacterium]